MADWIRYHPFPLDGVEAMTAVTSRSYARHTHDQYGIGIVDWGGHSSWSGRGQVEAGAGTFICLNPGEVHDGRAAGARTRSWRMLYLDPGVMATSCADISDGSQPHFTFCNPVFKDRSLHHLFEAVFAYADATGAPACKMAGEAAVLSLVARLRIHSTSRPIYKRTSTACIRRARERIDDDPATPLTLSALAREAGLSRYQVLRGFAREVGMTPHAYILQRRVALARRLIRDGHALVEVAALAGFCDQSHLTRCFLRQFGVTPGRYASKRTQAR